jgi:hypothetical protein
MTYLGKKGYTIFKSQYNELMLNDIRKELNVKPVTKQSFETKEYPIYRESTTKLYLPRYYGLSKLGEFKNTLSQGEDINITFEGNLFDYQHNIINK